jgi:hypothetical protein
MNETGKSPRIALAVAWLLVGLPLAWGVSQTIAASMALFR